jgi:hypothetical protein
MAAETQDPRHVTRDLCLLLPTRATNGRRFPACWVAPRRAADADDREERRRGTLRNLREATAGARSRHLRRPADLRVLPKDPPEAEGARKRPAEEPSRGREFPTTRLQTGVAPLFRNYRVSGSFGCSPREGIAVVILVPAPTITARTDEPLDRLRRCRRLVEARAPRSRGRLGGSRHRVGRP